MSYREFLSWLAYWEIESPGEQNFNLQAALIGARICRAFGAKVDPDEFLPKRRKAAKPKRPRQSEAETLAVFEAATRSVAPRRPGKGK